MLDDAIEAAVGGETTQEDANALRERPNVRRPRPESPPPEQAQTGNRRLRCVFYRDQAASRKCEGCGNFLCGAAVRKKTVDHEVVEVCPCEVGARVLRFEDPARPTPRVGFEKLLALAFGYPLGGAGPIILLFGTAMFATLFSLGRVMLTASALGRLSLLGVVPIVLGGIYLTAYLVKVVFATAMGDEDPPSWPELGRWWESIVRPCLMITGALVLCGGMAAVYAFATGRFDVGFWSLAVAGSAFLPMAMACVAVDPTINALNPVQWVANIAIVPAEYVAAVLTLYVAVGLKLFAESTFGQIPYAGVIFSTGIALYFLMVDMRVLGLIFHANRERLGW